MAPRFPVWRNRNVLTFSLAGFFSDVSQEPALTVLPAFIVSVVGQHNAPLYLGVALGLSEACAHIFKLVFGWLSARVSFRKWLVAGGYAVEGSFMAAIGLATAGWHIVLSRAISRVGKGMRSPARDAMLASSVDKEDYGAGFGLQRTADTFGAVVGIGLLLWLVTFLSHRSIFYLALIPALMASVSIILWAYDPRGDLPLTHDWRILPDLWKLPRSYWLFLCIVGLFGITKVHPVVLLLRQYNIAETNGLLASQYVVIVYLFYNIARAIQGYIAGKAGDIYSREHVLAIGGYALFGTAVALMSFDIVSIVLNALLFIMLGCADATIITLEKSIVAQIVPEYLRDVGYGMMFLVKGFAMLIAGWAVGTLWSVYTPEHAFVYTAIVSLCATVTLLLASYINGFTKSG